MRFQAWPGRLGWRIAIALALAAVAVVALDVAVAAWDRAHEPPPRLAPPPDGAAPVGPDEARALRFPIARTSSTIAVARRLGSLPPDVAPVIEILPAGELALRRPPPLASAPGELPPVSRDGYGAGIVLPFGAEGIADLTPAQRGAFLALLQGWIPERPVQPDRLVGVDLALAPRDVAALLAWLP